MRFTKAGKVLYAEPETGDDSHGNYGTIKRGTWRHLDGNKFQIKLHNVYDKDYFTITAIKENKKHFRTLTNLKGEYHWSADSWTLYPTMTASDFQSMFERAAESSQEKIQQNGYDKPDKKVNDPSSTATSESTLSVHLTGGQSSIDYITKKMGDQGWEIEGGTMAVLTVHQLIVIMCHTILLEMIPVICIAFIKMVESKKKTS